MNNENQRPNKYTLKTVFCAIEYMNYKDSYNWNVPLFTCCKLQLIKKLFTPN